MAQNSRKSDRAYPLFAVRLTENQKEQLAELVDKVRGRLNANLKPTEARWLKNDVIFEGLMLGLPLIKGKPKGQD